MTAVLTATTLNDFLQMGEIDALPAWEFTEGMIYQKPMPKLRHSLLQKRLIAVIDAASEVYTALPELRCTFGNCSIVPDIAVLAWDQLAQSETGEFVDAIVTAPIWTIEILSPGQSVQRVIDNFLHGLHYGTALAWLVDPHDRSVLVLRPHQELLICRDDDALPSIPGLDLALRVADLWAWLTKQ